MSETSASLLDQLRLRPDDESWQRLIAIYTPLIHGWLQRHARLHSEDADDVVQDVLSVLVKKLSDFERQRTGSFRAWLRTITVNCLRNFNRSGRVRPGAVGGSDFLAVIDQLEDPASGLSAQWDQEHDRHVTQRLLQMIKPDFEATTWSAFQQVAIQGIPADTVATQLGISTNAVFIAKSRVLAKLREAGKGLIE